MMSAQANIAAFAVRRFNLTNNTLVSSASVEELLSTSGAELLKVFVGSPNRVLQPEQRMGQRDLSPTEHTIDVRISWLRRKLEPNQQNPVLIKTVYGAGYLFLVTVNRTGG